MPDRDLVDEPTRSVLARLEAMDSLDRMNGTERSARLRSVSPEVGRFLHTMVLASGARRVVECGTSGGYSTLWLASAARANGGSVLTFETDPAKIEIATGFFVDSGLDDVIALHHIDAAEGLGGLEPGSADLVFIDTDKEYYEELLPLAVLALRDGGTLVADNLLSHADELGGFRDKALQMLDGLVVPIGRGELVAVKVP